MNSMIIFVAGVIVAIAVLIVVRKKKDPSPASQNDAGGFRAVNEKRQQEKRAAKDKIMELAGRQNEISNGDAQKLLGVSDATVTNYLQELENEGKLEQVGSDGRFVRYHIKTQ
jgi:predicted HTH transcriptional regulator